MPEKTVEKLIVAPALVVRLAGCVVNLGAELTGVAAVAGRAGASAKIANPSRPSRPLALKRWAGCLRSLFSDDGVRAEVLP